MLNASPCTPVRRVPSRTPEWTGPPLRNAQGWYGPTPLAPFLAPPGPGGHGVRGTEGSGKGTRVTGPAHYQALAPPGLLLVPVPLQPWGGLPP